MYKSCVLEGTTPATYVQFGDLFEFEVLVHACNCYTMTVMGTLI